MMDKKTLYVIFAVGLVLLFLIEPFAIGMMGSGGTGSGNGGGETSGNADSFTGYAVANVTIVRYEPYLIVNGNSSYLETVKDKLLSEGIATYATRSGGSLVVSLKSSKDVPASAGRFELANASTIATAYISTSPTVTVVGKDGAMVAAEGTSISMQIRPLYEEGSTHEASFSARVDSMRITGMGQLTIMPSSAFDVPARAALMSPPMESYAVEIAWKDRAAAKQIVASSGAAYKQRSFVYVPNATKEALDIALAGKPYVTGTQPGIISVDNGYADSESLGNELFQRGYAAVFPQSIASFGDEGGKQSADLLLGRLASANISATMSFAWSAKVLLPPSLSKEGKTYFGPPGGMELLIEGAGAPPENASEIEVSLDIETVGSRITRVTAARLAGGSEAQ